MRLRQQRILFLIFKLYKVQSKRYNLNSAWNYSIYFKTIRFGNIYYIYYIKMKTCVTQIKT